MTSACPVRPVPSVPQRGRELAMAALLLVAGGCKKGDPYVLVTVTAPGVVDVVALHGRATIGGRSGDFDTALLDAHPAALHFPTSFSLGPLPTTGALHLELSGLDADGRTVASGMGDTTVSGDVTAMVVVLGAGPPPDLATSDGVVPPDLGAPALDLVGVDLAGADLALPDLAVPDLKVPDLAVADAGTTTACGKTSILTDNFNTSVRSASWLNSFQDAPATYAQNNGRLEITLGTSNLSAYAGYESTITYDLVDDRVFVQAPVVPTQVAGTQMALNLYPDKIASSLQMLLDQNTLSCRVRVNGATSTPFSVPYNATNHQWWQIRESGGRVYFEVSPDGVVWNPLGNVADPFELTYLHIQVMAGTYASVTAPGIAAFDNMNGGAAPTMKFCPASTVTDDFADNVQGTVWGAANADNGCVMTESGGTVSMSPATNDGNSYCSYVTGNAYDLTGGSVRLRVQGMVNFFPCAEAFLEASDYVTRNMVGVAQEDGVIRCQTRTCPTRTTCVYGQIGPDVTYSPTAHRFWRLREQTGTIFCETSPDKVTWNPLASGPSPLSVTAVRLELGAGTCNPVLTPGTATFDDFNL